MTELFYEPSSNLSRNTDEKKLKKESSKWRGRMPLWLIWSIIIIFWALLVYGCFSLARHYIGGIQQQLTHIQQTNDANVEDLNRKLEDLKLSMTEHQDQAILLQEQFKAVESELELVKEEMSLAGATLDTSADTKKALSERITDLSKELGELRKLIKKLEEAARVY